MRKLRNIEAQSRKQLMNIIEWYYHKKAIRGLKQKYLLELEVDKILKDWITACIIDRKQETRRKELIESQSKVKEDELFLKWLKTLK